MIITFQNELNAAKIGFYASYGFSITLQILLPAYFGNEIEIKSAATFHAVYESDWIHGDKELKMMHLIAMENMKKPIVLRAYRIFAINLENFLFVSRKLSFRK